MHRQLLCRRPPTGQSASPTPHPRSCLAAVCCAVSGAGMSADVVHRIFQPFFQASPSAAFRTSGGLGLGLAMVKAIIDAHSGLINVQSSEGKGARFDVLIPASSGTGGGPPPAGKSPQGNLTGFPLLAAAGLTESAKQVESALTTGLDDFTPCPDVLGLDHAAKARWTQRLVHTKESEHSAAGKERTRSSSAELALRLQVEQPWSELAELDKDVEVESRPSPSSAEWKKDAPVAAGGQARASSHSPATDATPGVASSSAVLVVDDSAVNRRLSHTSSTLPAHHHPRSPQLAHRCLPLAPLTACSMVRMLQVQGFTTALQAAHGQEALELLEKRRTEGEPDVALVLLDLNMPVMDGFTFLHHLRDRLHVDIPVVTLSASQLQEDRDKCTQLGANGQAQPLSTRARPPPRGCSHTRPSMCFSLVQRWCGSRSARRRCAAAFSASSLAHSHRRRRSRQARDDALRCACVRSSVLRAKLRSRDRMPSCGRRCAAPLARTLW